MTTNNDNTNVVHLLSSGLTFRPGTGPDAAPSVVGNRGDEVEVTDLLRERNTDRFGHCWLDLADNEDEQVRRWGRVMFRRGHFPASELPTVPGTAEHASAAWDAHRVAAGIVDRAERRAALQQVDRLYGDATATSRTIATYDPYRGDSNAGH